VFESTACLLWLLEQHGRPPLAVPPPWPASCASLLEYWLVIPTSSLVVVSEANVYPLALQHLYGHILRLLCMASRYSTRWQPPHAGEGKLEPPKSDAAARAAFLQWTIAAETGLTVGLMDVFWHTMQFPEEKRKPQIAERGKDL
jgi:hypothetical protein